MSYLMTKNMLPSNWGKQKRQEIKLVDVIEGSREYEKVLDRLSGSALENLSHIVRVQNPFLYGRYQLRKVEYKKLFNSCEEK